VARVCFRRSAGDAANPGAGLEALEASLVLASIGHRGRPVPELPFDAESGTVPSRAGRVIDPASGRLRPGVYVTGWIKRGASGFIGTNRGCAQETIRALVEDYNAGRLAATGTGARRARAA
jgi:ferredoxin--NADP+ reductase